MAPRLRRYRRAVIVPLAAAIFAALIGAGLPTGPAVALPLYARQTGQPCATCHTAFPELTPFGRRFKLGGYTLGGGDSSLPFSGMLEPAFTHTDAAQPGAVQPAPGATPSAGTPAPRGRGGGGGRGGPSGGPSGSPIGGAARAMPKAMPNDDFVLEQGAVFTGGAIADNLGAFVRATYDNASGHAAWDNTDLRYANTGKVAGHDLIWGVSVNNNPTVQDVWNTTPAWRFPYHVRRAGTGGGITTLVEGRFSRRSVGFGGYWFLDDLVYAELSGYSSLSNNTQRWLGIDSTGAVPIDGIAPYWRVAVEPIFGKHALELGTFGLRSDTRPMPGAGTDSATDLALDAQYQWLGDDNTVTLRANWIHEDRDLQASHALGLASNLHNSLHSVHVSASYIFDSTWSLTVERFSFDGTNDKALYRNTNGNPSNSGWTTEIAYLPFMHGGPSFWPWLNARIGLQYTFNDQNSHDNTLFLYSLIMF